MKEKCEPQYIYLDEKINQKQLTANISIKNFHSWIHNNIYYNNFQNLRK